MKRLVRILFILIIFNIIIEFNCRAITTDYDRLYGSNRYITSIEVSKEGWDTSNVVILATGDSYPDALCAAPLAKKYNAPIILNNKRYLDINVRNEILRLKAKKVIMIGGKGALSLQIENEIKNMSMQCERIAGSNRYETSVKIAEKIGAVSQIVVATGNNFADALSIASVAAIKGMPILLCDRNNINDYLKKYIQNNKISKTYIIGGTAIISSEIERKFPKAERLFGSNRYETNINIIKKFANEFNKLYITSGIDFPDALSGSALSSKNLSFIVLTPKNPQKCTQNFVRENINKDIDIYVIGGKAAVSEDTMIKLFYGDIYTISNERTFQIKQVITISNNSGSDTKNIKLKNSIGYLNGSPYQTDEKLYLSGTGLKLSINNYNEKEANICLSQLENGQSRQFVIVRTFKQGTLDYNVDLSNTNEDYSDFTDYMKYISPQDKIESNNVMIRNKAYEVIGNTNNPYIKAKKIYTFVNTDLNYDYTEANKGALNALITKKGVCEDYADLFVAMCRSVGVPARVVYGYWVKTNNLDKPLCIDTYSHAWVEFYLPVYGWIVAEPTISYYINDKKITLYNDFGKLPQVGHFIDGYAGNYGFSCSWNGYGSLDVKREVYVTEIKK